jgi:hypothetical protein
MAMTEPQLRAFPAFKVLPIYDEGDERSDTITTVAAAGPYQAIRECPRLQDVEDCLKDPRLVPLGGLRAGRDGQQVVVAYFGQKQ